MPRWRSAIPSIDRVETLDARWLAREGDGLGMTGLLRAARRWRAAATISRSTSSPTYAATSSRQPSGAARTAGWASGGGGPVLDVALDYDPTSHTAANARRLVRERVRPDAPGARATAPRPSPKRRPPPPRLVSVLARDGRSSACTSAAGGRSSSGRRNGSRTWRRDWPMLATRRSSPLARRAIGRSSAGCRPRLRRDW